MGIIHSCTDDDDDGLYKISNPTQQPAFDQPKSIPPPSNQSLGPLFKKICEILCNPKISCDKLPPLLIKTSEHLVASYRTSTGETLFTLALTFNASLDKLQMLFYAFPFLTTQFSTNMKSSSQSIPLHYPFHTALMINPTPHLIIFLIERGASLFRLDVRNRNALHYYCESEHWNPTILELLLHNAQHQLISVSESITTTTSKPNTPLIERNIVSTEQVQYNAVNDWFIQCKTTLRSEIQKMAGYNTPVSISMTKYLNLPCSSGTTPILEASLHNAPIHIISILLKYGAHLLEPVKLVLDDKLSTNTDIYSKYFYLTQPSVLGSAIHTAYNSSFITFLLSSGQLIPRGIFMSPNYRHLLKYYSTFTLFPNSSYFSFTETLLDHPHPFISNYFRPNWISTRYDTTSFSTHKPPQYIDEVKYSTFFSQTYSLPTIGLYASHLWHHQDLIQHLLDWELWLEAGKYEQFVMKIKQQNLQSRIRTFLTLVPTPTLSVIERLVAQFSKLAGIDKPKILNDERLHIINGAFNLQLFSVLTSWSKIYSQSYLDKNGTLIQITQQQQSSSNEEQQQQQQQQQFKNPIIDDESFPQSVSSSIDLLHKSIVQLAADAQVAGKNNIRDILPTLYDNIPNESHLPKLLSTLPTSLRCLLNQIQHPTQSQSSTQSSTDLQTRSLPSLLLQTSLSISTTFEHDHTPIYLSQLSILPRDLKSTFLDTFRTTNPFAYARQFSSYNSSEQYRLLALAQNDSLLASQNFDTDQQPIIIQNHKLCTLTEIDHISIITSGIYLVNPYLFHQSILYETNQIPFSPYHPVQFNNNESPSTKLSTFNKLSKNQSSSSSTTGKCSNDQQSTINCDDIHSPPTTTLSSPLSVTTSTIPTPTSEASLLQQLQLQDNDTTPSITNGILPQPELVPPDPLLIPKYTTLYDDLTHTKPYPVYYAPTFILPSNPYQVYGFNYNFRPQIPPGLFWYYLYYARIDFDEFILLLQTCKPFLLNDFAQTALSYSFIRQVPESCLTFLISLYHNTFSTLNYQHYSFNQQDFYGRISLHYYGMCSSFYQYNIDIIHKLCFETNLHFLQYSTNHTPTNKKSNHNQDLFTVINPHYSSYQSSTSSSSTTSNIIANSDHLLLGQSQSLQDQSQPQQHQIDQSRQQMDIQPGHSFTTILDVMYNTPLTYAIMTHAPNYVIKLLLDLTISYTPSQLSSIQSTNIPLSLTPYGFSSPSPLSVTSTPSLSASASPRPSSSGQHKDLLDSSLLFANTSHNSNNSDVSSSNSNNYNNPHYPHLLPSPTMVDINTTRIPLLHLIYEQMNDSTIANQLLTPNYINRMLKYKQQPTQTLFQHDPIEKSKCWLYSSQTIINTPYCVSTPIDITFPTVMNNDTTIPSNDKQNDDTIPKPRQLLPGLVPEPTPNLSLLISNIPKQQWSFTRGNASLQNLLYLISPIYNNEFSNHMPHMVPCDNFQGSSPLHRPNTEQSHPFWRYVTGKSSPNQSQLIHQPNTLSDNITDVCSVGGGSWRRDNYQIHTITQKITLFSILLRCHPDIHNWRTSSTPMVTSTLPISPFGSISNDIFIHFIALTLLSFRLFCYYNNAYISNDINSTNNNGNNGKKQQDLYKDTTKLLTIYINTYVLPFSHYYRQQNSDTDIMNPKIELISRSSIQSKLYSNGQQRSNTFQSILNTKLHPNYIPNLPSSLPPITKSIQSSTLYQDSKHGSINSLPITSTTSHTDNNNTIESMTSPISTSIPLPVPTTLSQTTTTSPTTTSPFNTTSDIKHTNYSLEQESRLWSLLIHEYLYKTLIYTLSPQTVTEGIVGHFLHPSNEQSRVSLQIGQNGELCCLNETPSTIRTDITPKTPLLRPHPMKGDIKAKMPNLHALGIRVLHECLPHSISLASNWFYDIIQQLE